MGWVTLTLRKTELKRTHADYQMELLQISRTKRQMARQYHYQQTQARHEGQEQMSAMFDDYKAKRDAQTQQLFQNLKPDGYDSRQGTSGTSGQTGGNSGNSGGSNAQSQTNTAIMQELNNAKEDYEYAKMIAQNDMEEELARIEEEANDTETALDQEQVQIEAQLEAISAEIEAVGSAISDQVQASTIKLA